MSEQTVARRYRGLLADGALRVQVQPDERVTGQQRWLVRVQCRPDAATALADSMAARGDVSWVSITSGGSELDEPLSPAQIAALHGATGPASAADTATEPTIRPDDAPLVAELARDGRAGVVALARATGWPQSRVSARLAELLASGAVHVTTDLAPGLQVRPPGVGAPVVAARPSPCRAAMWVRTRSQ